MILDTNFNSKKHKPKYSIITNNRKILFVDELYGLVQAEITHEQSDLVNFNVLTAQFRGKSNQYVEIRS